MIMKKKKEEEGRKRKKKEGEKTLFQLKTRKKGGEGKIYLGLFWNTQQP